MINQFSIVIERFSESDIKLIRVEGYTNRAQLLQAAVELESSNTLAQKLVDGTVHVSFSQEGYLPQEKRNCQSGLLQIDVKMDGLTILMDGTQIDFIPSGDVKSLDKRMVELVSEISGMVRLSVEQEIQIQQMGYEFSMELFRTPNPFPLNSQAYEAFDIGFSKGMRELLNAI